MIGLTSRAGSAIHEYLIGPETHGVRLFVAGKSDQGAVVGIDPMHDQPLPKFVQWRVGDCGVRFFVAETDVAEIAGRVLDFRSDQFGRGFRVSRAAREESTDLTLAVRTFVEESINPRVAAHGGEVEVVRVQDDEAVVRLHGGCQGCRFANTTLQAIVSREIVEAFPRIRTVTDETDHAAGEAPWSSINECCSS